MTLLILIGSAIVFFVLGIALIYHGMQSSPDVRHFVPKVDFEQVKSKLDLTAKEEEGLKLQLDSLALELQDARFCAENAEKAKKDIDSLRERDQHYQSVIQELEQSLNFISRRADEQAKEALDAIVALNSRNKKLRAELQERLQKEFPQEKVEALKQEKASLEEKVQTNQSRIITLEQQLKGVQETSHAELEIARETIGELTAQNQRLEEGIAQITKKITVVEKEFSRSQQEKEEQLANAQELIDELRREQQQLRQEDADPHAIAELEGQISRIRAESEGRLSEAHQNVGRLQEEIHRLQKEIQENQRQREDLKSQIEESQRPLPSGGADQLMESSAHARLLEEKRVMDAELSELREMNLFLKQKERLLSQELLKSQTQALGLEKICQEFRKKIEGR